jgi:hypothetical protein
LIFRITYKRTAAALDLPEEVEADSYRPSGRFFNFYVGEGFEARIVATISTDLVALIAATDESAA